MKLTRGMEVDTVINRRVALYDDRFDADECGTVISADPATRRVRIKWDDGEISCASMDRGLMLVSEQCPEGHQRDKT